MKFALTKLLEVKKYNSQFSKYLKLHLMLISYFAKLFIHLSFFKIITSPKYFSQIQLNFILRMWDLDLKRINCKGNHNMAELFDSQSIANTFHWMYKSSIIEDINNILSNKFHLMPTNHPYIKKHK